ncbi:MAG: HEAT repeat domain-containing protein, partial [Planctomycetota bacterium]
NERARAALGYRKHGDRWMTEEEINRAKGLVKHKGEWMTPGQKEIEEALEERRKLDAELQKEVRRLVQQLESDSREAREEAEARLDGMDDDLKTEPFLAALKSPVSGVRLYVVRELGRMKAAEAVPHLARTVLHDAEDYVRQAAIESLRAIGDGSTYTHFLPPLSKDSAILRVRAVEALGEYPDFGAAGDLVKLLRKDVSSLSFVKKCVGRMIRVKDGDVLLRNGDRLPIPSGIWREAGLYTAEGVDVLNRELEYVRDALRRITGQDFGTDTKAWKDWYEDEVKARRKAERK